MERIRQAVLQHVTASSARLTPQHLEKTVRENWGLDKSRARDVLKDLVARGKLEYTYEFGSTYLVQSFNQPVRISSHVVITPPGQGHRYRPAPGDVVIQIKPGAAFGDGRHPTTRLSLKAIEFLLKKGCPDGLRRKGTLLDIGTGSGILAIVALCLGVERGLALDIDPCALAEASENLAVNHLAGRLIVSDRMLHTIHSPFSMVIANLRYPSLKRFYPQIKRLTRLDGAVVLSGFRCDERTDLMALYTASLFECIWTAEELGWAAAVLKKVSPTAL